MYRARRDLGVRRAAQRLGAVSRGGNFSFPPVEEVLPSDCLTVPPVLDLDPGRRVRRVPGARQLRDDPFHVPLANYVEQVSQTCWS